MANKLTWTLESSLLKCPLGLAKHFFGLYGAIQIKLLCHSVQTYFEDASFLPSNFFNGVSKNLGVIYTQ